MKISKDTTIAEVIKEHPDKIKVLQNHLHAVCLGCPHSQMETLEEAAEHHGIKIEKLLELLNKSKIKDQKSK